MNQPDSLQNQHEYESFFKNALALKGSVTPKVIKNVGFIILYTGLISYLCDLFRLAVLPIGPFEYGGSIMVLILVFRVNAGYDRWYEARKLWGNIVNHSRDITITLVASSNNPSWLFKITNMILILPYLMKDNLRGHTDLTYLSQWIDEESRQALHASKHRPNMLTKMITKELQHFYQQNLPSSIHLQELIGGIINAQGACERILKTPMPFVMAIKSRRFILFFLLMLPFALADVSLFISPLIAGIVSYALFSLDQIGIELQNPFSETNLSHLPLDSICNTIESNILEIRGSQPMELL